MVFEQLLQLALARLLRLEQPRVLDGDHGLVGEGLEELDLPVGEESRLGTRHEDCSDDLPLADHWHTKAAAVTAGPSSLLVLVVRISRHVRDKHIRDMNNSTSPDCARSNCRARSDAWETRRAPPQPPPRS